jgi:hypothetical protein
MLWCEKCDEEIISDEFLPEEVTCQSCKTVYVTDWDCDWDNYYVWITGEKRDGQVQCESEQGKEV